MGSRLGSSTVHQRGLNVHCRSSDSTRTWRHLGCVLGSGGRATSCCRAPQQPPECQAQEYCPSRCLGPPDTSRPSKYVPRASGRSRKRARASAAPTRCVGLWAVLAATVAARATVAAESGVATNGRHQRNRDESLYRDAAVQRTNDVAIGCTAVKNASGARLGRNDAHIVTVGHARATKTGRARHRWLAAQRRRTRADDW